MLSIFISVLIASAISVYVFHDVDRDKIGHLNEAFGGLCTENVLFTLMVGGGVTLLTALGRRFLGVKGCSPRAKLGLILGVCVTVFQYPWYLAARWGFPKLADFALSVYLIAAIILCAVILVRDSFFQTKVRTEFLAQFDTDRLSGI